MTNKPSTTPLASGYKAAPTGKIISHEETPAHTKDIMQPLREAGKENAQIHWNEIVDFVHSLTKGKDYTGNDFLSMMGTYITYFTATWMVAMKVMIADHDEAGVLLEDIIAPLVDGIKQVAKSAKLGKKDD